MKKTKARMAILEFLKSHSTPVDAMSIYEYLKRNDLSTDVVTVYRTLDYFYKESIVNKIDLQEGKFRYEIADRDHHHLICTKCGRIEDVSDCSIPLLEEEILRKKKFKVTRHSLEFFGLCQNCQR